MIPIHPSRATTPPPKAKPDCPDSLGSLEGILSRNLKVGEVPSPTKLGASPDRPSCIPSNLRTRAQKRSQEESKSEELEDNPYPLRKKGCRPFTFPGISEHTQEEKSPESSAVKVFQNSQKQEIR